MLGAKANIVEAEADSIQVEVKVTSFDLEASTLTYIILLPFHYWSN